MTFSRRDVCSAAALGLALSTPLASIARPAKPRQWGLESGTVLKPLELDFAGTLAQVAALGITRISTAGSFGRDPAYVRHVLDANGLTSPACHITPASAYRSHVGWAQGTVSPADDRRAFSEAFTLDNARRAFDEAIAQAHVLGQHYLIWSILLPEHFATRQALDSYMALFNELGQTCAREGLQFGFHNHARELAKLDNDVILEIILRETDPALVKMEADIFWLAKGGVDPAGFLARHPGRVRLCHLKDMNAAGEVVPPGDGHLDIVGFIAQADRFGMEHYLIEIDKAVDPLADLARSMAWLRRTIG